MARVLYQTALQCRTHIWHQATSAHPTNAFWHTPKSPHAIECGTRAGCYCDEPGWGVVWTLWHLSQWVGYMSEPSMDFNCNLWVLCEPTGWTKYKGGGKCDEG